MKDTKIKILFSVLGVIVIVVSLISIFGGEEEEQPRPQPITQTEVVGGGFDYLIQSSNGRQATSSEPTFFGVGGTAKATTTLLDLNMVETEAVGFFITANSTSSPQTVYWVYEASNNGDDWYGVGKDITYNQVTTGTALDVVNEDGLAVIHKWQVPATGAHMKYVPVDDIFSKRLRIRFWADVASTTLHVESAQKQVF